MKKYVIVVAATLYDLERNVTEMLNNNWAPVCGISVSPIDGTRRAIYYQAMIHKNHDVELHRQRQEDTEQPDAPDLFTNLKEIVSAVAELDEHSTHDDLDDIILQAKAVSK